MLRNGSQADNDVIEVHQRGLLFQAGQNGVGRSLKCRGSGVETERHEQKAVEAEVRHERCFVAFLLGCLHLLVPAITV